MKQFKRNADGSIIGSFSGRERGLLQQLATQLDELLDGLSDEPGELRDPALSRLLPDAYPDDPDAAAEFRRFTQGDLVQRKRQNADLLIETLGSAPRGELRLTEIQAQAWLRSLTDLRLTLASRLGIKEDGDERRLGLAQLPTRQLYAWLGFVQDSLVRAIDS